MTATSPDTWRVRFPDGRVTTCDDQAHAWQVWQGWGGTIHAPGAEHDPTRVWLDDAIRLASDPDHTAALAALGAVLDRCDDVGTPYGPRTARDLAVLVRAAIAQTTGADQ